ncbi:hypothetical protein Tsubulata_011841 [Turnera subulata]|uniref:RRM domain-containing protein n=1 Tax=Turnera subulata TaxID=218843 RepID=A0A9Q0G378_9ROSI|nr:hypothetical protein Tsubulata_011841 [Turnera subulata]
MKQRIRPVPLYFSKWSRKQVQDAMDNGQAISLYVERLAAQWTPTDVYRVMSKYGEVVDVYISNRLSRAGRRFGFVRFRKMGDVQRLLADVNRVQVEGGTVRANLARSRTHARPQKSQKEPLQSHSTVEEKRTYAKAVKGSNENAGVSFIPSSDISGWLSRCAVGIAKDPMRLESILLLWKLHDLNEVEVSELGGDSVLVCFPSKESMMMFTQQPPDWIPLWFKTFAPWKQGDIAVNRRVWLTVRRVPLNAWCNEFFQLVGSIFGQLLRIDEETGERRRLGSARMEILTELGSLINKELVVSVAGQTYTIFAIEDLDAFSGEGSTVLSEGLEIDDRTSSADGKSGDEEGPQSRRSGEFNAIDGQADPTEKNTDSFGILKILEHNSRLDCGNGHCAETAELLTNQHKVTPTVLEKILGQRILCTHCSQPFHVEDAASGDYSRLQPHTSRVSSSRSRRRTSTEHSSPASHTSSYLIRRLDVAVKTARVTQRKKFKKLKDTGSLTSLKSSTNNDIRRINERLTQASGAITAKVTSQPLDEAQTSRMGDNSESHTPVFSFQHQEAVQTTRLGDALGWDDTANPQGIDNMAKELVVKEAVEWSMTQRDV